MENNNDFFVLEKKENILYLTMNAPENNLMTNEFLLKYENIINELEKNYASDNSIKGLIIKGEGRHFSVGADVKSLIERTSDESGQINTAGDIPPAHLRQKHAFTVISKMPFPVISVVKGFCIGSGSEIAINSHIRICENNSRIGQPESTFGILPGLGGIARTVEVCGLSEAIDMVFTGELFTPQKAYQRSWADIVCQKKEGVQKAVDLINFIDRLDIPFDPADIPEYIDNFINEKG